MKPSRRVRAQARTESWVVDGAYRGKLGDLVLERADLVVWLDLPIRVWLPRLLRRTLARIMRREELWAGNRESFRGAFVGRDALILWSLRRTGAGEPCTRSSFAVSRSSACARPPTSGAF